MIKNIIKRALGYTRKQRINEGETHKFIKFKELIDSKKLSIGDNTEINDLTINIFGSNSNKRNIKIGDNCLIQGSIILYSPDAEVKIGNRVFIGPNTTIFCYKDISIEDDVMISWGCTLIDTNAHSLSSLDRMSDVLDWKKGWQNKNWDVVESRSITIRRNSWIGFNSIVTKGVTLNKGCIVASGSVVTKSFKEYSVVGGNPAKFIKQTT
jgi:acetyltransferase-like isoleucine patch superfamily enzyme